MPHRSYASTANYRFGFNGKENDNEPKGLGNEQDYGMRIYDPRLGKFLSEDPLRKYYPWYTPYQFAGNTPIANIDLDGAEPKPSISGTQEGDYTTTKGVATTGIGGYGEVSQGWHWHSGGLGTGKFEISADKKSQTEIVTKAGWYTPEEYVKVLESSSAAKQLAFDAGFTRWVRPPIGASESLAKFVGKGLNESARSSLSQAALNVGLSAYGNASGMVSPSSFNVEDMLGLGVMLKQGLKGTGVIVLKNLASTEIGKIIENRIALGVSEHLDDFAKSIGGATWKSWGTKDFQSQFLDVINNPNNKIFFNLTGPDGKALNVWKAVTEGSRGLSTSRATSWELYQIYSNQGALQRTTFYFNGAQVANPFK